VQVKTCPPPILVWCCVVSFLAGSTGDKKETPIHAATTQVLLRCALSRPSFNVFLTSVRSTQWWAAAAAAAVRGTSNSLSVKFFLRVAFARPCPTLKNFVNYFCFIL